MIVVEIVMTTAHHGEQICIKNYILMYKIMGELNSPIILQNKGVIL